MIKDKINKFSIVAITGTDFKNHLFKSFLVENELLSDDEKIPMMEIVGFQEKVTLENTQIVFEQNKINVSSTDKKNMVEEVKNSILPFIDYDNLIVKYIGINFDFKVDEILLKQNFRLLEDNTEFINFDYKYEHNNVINRIRYYVDEQSIRCNFNSHNEVNKSLSKNALEKIIKKGFKELESFYKNNEHQFI